MSHPGLWTSVESWTIRTAWLSDHKNRHNVHDHIDEEGIAGQDEHQI